MRTLYEHNDNPSFSPGSMKYKLAVVVVFIVGALLVVTAHNYHWF